MQIKSKIFPYPILNKNKNFSSFGEYNFELSFIPRETKDSYCLSNCCFKSNSKTINELFDDGKIKMALVIECSYTIFRKAFDIKREPQNFNLSKADFIERVDVSLFAYATQDFEMPSTECDQDYKELPLYKIEKYDIVAADDGFNFDFKHDESEGDFAQSIFSIIKSETLEEGKYAVDCDIGKKITITLSKKDYGNYKIIYTVPAYKEVFFNMILVPSLIEGLELCKSYLGDDKTLEDVGNRYVWFRSVSSAYQKLTGLELTEEIVREGSPVSMAQVLLGKPFGHALEQLVKETYEPNNKGDNFDE